MSSNNYFKRERTLSSSSCHSVDSNASVEGGKVQLMNAKMKTSEIQEESSAELSSADDLMHNIEYFISNDAQPILNHTNRYDIFLLFIFVYQVFIIGFIQNHLP